MEKEGRRAGSLVLVVVAGSLGLVADDGGFGGEVVETAAEGVEEDPARDDEKDDGGEAVPDAEVNAESQEDGHDQAKAAQYEIAQDGGGQAGRVARTKVYDADAEDLLAEGLAGERVQDDEVERREHSGAGHDEDGRIFDLLFGFGRHDEGTIVILFEAERDRKGDGKHDNEGRDGEKDAVEHVGEEAAETAGRFDNGAVVERGRWVAGRGLRVPFHDASFDIARVSKHGAPGERPAV